MVWTGTHLHLHLHEPDYIFGSVTLIRRIAKSTAKGKEIKWNAEGDLKD